MNLITPYTLPTQDLSDLIKVLDVSREELKILLMAFNLNYQANFDILYRDFQLLIKSLEVHRFFEVGIIPARTFDSTLKVIRKEDTLPLGLKSFTNGFATQANLDKFNDSPKCYGKNTSVIIPHFI